MTYYFSLANYYYSFFDRQRKYSLLRTALDELIGANADHNKFVALVAIIAAELGDFGRAQQELGRVDLDLLIVGVPRAHVYRLMGMLNEALKEVESALRLEPVNVSALVEKSLALGGLGRYSDSLITLDYVLSLDSYNTLAMLFKAETLELMGKTSKALKLYRQIGQVIDGPLRALPSLTYSRPIKRARPIRWDSNVWVGRRLSIYTVEGLLSEGGNGYVLKARGRGTGGRHKGPESQVGVSRRVVQGAVQRGEQLNSAFSKSQHSEDIRY